MDGVTTLSSFRTPARILVPKLVVSRDGWKDKANQRKKKIKAARIRIRDLGNSRDKWKVRAHDAEAQVVELQKQLQQAQQDLAASQDENARLHDELKKK